MFEEYINQKMMVEKLQECISIRSIKAEAEPGMPYGRNVYRALEYTLRLASELGFRTANIDGHVGYAEYGEGEEMIAVLCHLDVVPEGDEWTYPPFEGRVVDGTIYGRGATDDKGPLIASLFSLKAIMDSGIRLKRRIRIIFGTDEESGSHDMIRYKETEELPVMAFTPDADYPVIFSEKSLVNLRMTKKLDGGSSCWTLVTAKGGSVVNQVPDSGQMILQRDGEQIKLTGRGAAAHGSAPQAGKNAIDDLIRQFQAHPCFAESAAELRAFADFYMDHLYDSLDGSGFDAACCDGELGGSTFNTGLLYGDREKIQLTLDCRFPASMDTGGVLQRIIATCEKTSIQAEITKNKPGLYMAKDHPLVTTLQKIYEEETCEKCEPIAIGGGTYAKTLPNTVAFGPIFPGRKNRIHEADEFVTIDELMKDVQIFIKALCALAGEGDQ